MVMACINDAQPPNVYISYNNGHFGSPREAASVVSILYLLLEVSLITAIVFRRRAISEMCKLLLSMALYIVRLRNQLLLLIMQMVTFSH